MSYVTLLTEIRDELRRLNRHSGREFPFDRRYVWDTLTDSEAKEDPVPLTPKAAYEQFGCVCYLCRRPWLP
jgi:hypothetical protein